MKAVNQPIRKKDAMALVTGKPVFMDDLVPKDCLIVKLLRSPHANAIVKEINKTAAEKVPGIEAIYTWEDVPQQRFTTDLSGGNSLRSSDSGSACAFCR